MQRLTESKNHQSSGSWHPGGRLFAFTEINPQTLNDLMILQMEGDEASSWKPGQPRVFLNAPFQETTPVFSPDGRWIAYQSNESGRPEVYVRPFPGPGGKWQISLDTDSFKPGKPRLWSPMRVATRFGSRSWDLHPDGERVAVAGASAAQTAKQDTIVLVYNLFDELKRLAPVPSPQSLVPSP